MEHGLKRFFLYLLWAWAVPVLAEDYWPATHLDFGHLKNVALARCYDNPDQLIGCYRAVGGALGFANDLQLTTAEPKPGEALVRDFGTVKLVRSADDDTVSSVYQFWQQLIAQRGRDVQALQAHFRNKQAPHIDFGAIVDFIKTLTPPEKEPGLAARGINEYFAVVFDPHTQLSTRHDLADSVNGADKSYVGVGISAYRLGARYLVTAVNADGPAAAQGVKANDFLTHVDGRPTHDLSLEQLVAQVRGTENSSVTLALLRNGQLLQIVVPRQKISLEAVETKPLKSDQRTYGYIRLQDFMNDKACDKTAAAMRKYRAQGAQGWVLDLRGNTGGSITIAVCVAGLFLGPQQVVAYKIDSETYRRQDYTPSSEKLTSSPLVVLVDGASASGAELLAGALQDNRRGWIVGEQTFGKGSTQSIRDFRIPGAKALTRSVTTGLFFLASDRTTQLEGITPDFVVPSRPDASEEERFTPREKDAYIAPIAFSQERWSSPQTEAIQTVTECVERNGSARSGYSAAQSQADYQLLYAIDVLNCQ
jgi:carboxyl-terminal processing protease